MTFVRPKRRHVFAAGALHGVPVMHTGVTGPRMTTPWRVPRARTSASIWHGIVTDARRFRGQACRVPDIQLSRRALVLGAIALALALTLAARFLRNAGTSY